MDCLQWCKSQKQNRNVVACEFVEYGNECNIFDDSDDVNIIGGGGNDGNEYDIAVCWLFNSGKNINIFLSSLLADVCL